MTKAFKIGVANLQFERVNQILALNLKPKSNNRSYSLTLF